MSCTGDRHRFAPNAPVCACGQVRTLLTTTGLPYPSWRLDAGSLRGIGNSIVATATDPHTGRRYEIREYLPDTVPDPLAQRRRFVTTAKSLAAVPVAAARILFPYTRGGRCYTVADPVQGVPFAVSASGSSEEQARNRLAEVLAALYGLHNAGAAAGPLFHGDLRADDLVAAGSGAGGDLHLLHPLYLENLLRENPLPPEHFQQADLLAAADIALAQVTGAGTPASRQNRLARLQDPALGATLEYLYGMGGGRAASAQTALAYLTLLNRAVGAKDRGVLQQLYAQYPSPRLKPLLAPPPVVRPAAQPPPPEPLRAPAPPPPPPTQPLTPPPSPIPGYRPVAAPPPATRRRRGGCGGCLLTLLLLLLGVAAGVAFLWREQPSPTSLDFTADPNPAVRKAHVQLHWTSSGFRRLELDGRTVPANGSETVIPTTSHRYTLTGIRTDGSRVVRDVDLTVLSRRSLRQDHDQPILLPFPATTEHSQPAESAPEERAQDPAASQAAVSPGGSAEAAAPTSTVRQLPPDTLEAIKGTLSHWSQAMLSNDPEREADCYAPQLDRYFLRTGVTQNDVRQYLTAFRNHGSLFTQFSLSDPLTVPEPDGTVEVRLNKDMTLTTSTGPDHEVTHTVLRLRQIDGAWKITSERDFLGTRGSR